MAVVKRNRKYELIFLNIAAVVLFFQNCSEKLLPTDVATNSSNTTTGDNAGNTPTPDPNAPPVVPPPPPGVILPPKVVSLLENKGPLSGDHLLKIKLANIPVGKKVEIFLSAQACLKMQIINITDVTCITPASATAQKTDVILKLDNAAADMLVMGYEYTPSESLTAIATDPNTALGRRGALPVVEGSKFYLWGGFAGVYIVQGRAYNKDVNTWEDMATANQPTPRGSHVAISTGRELIVWGGFNGANLNTGGRYNYMTKTWLPVSTVGAPSARTGSAAVWTGSKMIVWGGGATNADPLNNTGAIYDPNTDTWEAMPIPPPKFTVDITITLIGTEKKC
ncbi:MAG: hypothetical protein SGJ18_16445 [Pseudomonadota bacterium]|nr:hypothetical protein [Pseudomonadota bacterium]